MRCGRRIDALSGMPTIRKGFVWHIGALREWDQINGDMEGPLLSVSSLPEAWRKIANLGGGPAWRISKPDGALKFIDANKIRRAGGRAHMCWAESEGLVEKGKAWVARVDSGGDTVEIFCRSHEEALLAHDSGCDIRTEMVFFMTERLSAFWNQRKRGIWSIARGDVVEDAVFCVLAETLNRERGGSVDGVWWNDRLDLTGYSAPRGGLVTSGEFRIEIDGGLRD